MRLCRDKGSFTQRCRPGKHGRSQECRVSGRKITCMVTKSIGWANSLHFWPWTLRGPYFFMKAMGLEVPYGSILALSFQVSKSELWNPKSAGGKNMSLSSHQECGAQRGKWEIWGLSKLGSNLSAISGISYTLGGNSGRVLVSLL